MENLRNISQHRNLGLTFLLNLPGFEVTITLRTVLNPLDVESMKDQEKNPFIILPNFGVAASSRSPGVLIKGS